MAVSFLFSHNVLYSCFFDKVNPVSLINEKTTNKCLDLAYIYDSCKCLCTSQTYQKILRGLSPGQQTKFDNLFQKDGTTMGVKGYSTDNIETLKESSISLSDDGYVITIVSEEEADKMEEWDHNNHICVFTPSIFLRLLEFVESLHYDNQLFKDSEFIEFLILMYLSYHLF